ncbi:MAG: SMI1/KNR4 family protein [Bdellovibrionales bacterium]|nr:SMI1/KNR4 family protein [Bdellovibrionales bacterium]
MAADLILSQQGAGLTEDIINQFERLYELSIPESFRSFLLRNNGGCPSRKRFSTSDGTIESMVTTFLPLRLHQFHNSIERELWLIERDCYLPDEILVIATDPRTARICLGIEGEFEGRVYYNPLDEQVDEDNEDRQLLLVADSFSDFLERLV